jgi:hypothetical protein
MKNLLYFALGALALTGCEDFLDTQNLTKKDTSNFPANVKDVEQQVVSIYNTLNTAVADPQCTYFYAAELASDDRFGGGGDNDKLMQAWDKIMNYNSDASLPFWKARYQGIFRANSTLTGIETMGLEGDDVDQLKGEALFLRAFFYSELAEMYGEVPLVLTTAKVNLPKSPAAEIYAQIASDLKEAVSLLNDESYDKTVTGHSTKWAAEALLARVYLFYTGYYKQSALPLAGGETFPKDSVIKYLNDCIDHSGHGLVGDFRNLWGYTNQYTINDYTKVAGKKGVDGNDLKWAGDGNKESVFAIKFSNAASWNTTIGYSNQYVLHFGIRGGQAYENTFPIGQGWGAGPVNPTMWTDWQTAEPEDLRREGSIMPVKELKGYTFGGWTMMEETDYWQMKCVHITAKTGTKDGEGKDKYYSSFTVPMFGAADNFQLDGVTDLVLIRYADVLLMHSELTGTADKMNLVRKRAGLDDVPYSLDALKKERRWELAFEGRRWADIRRWGDAADLLAKQEGVKIYTSGSPAVMKPFGGGYKARYNATGGFFPIPESEIALSNGVLQQSAGYDDASSKYTGW